MKKKDNRILKLLLIFLVLALIAVVGYIILREIQYDAGEKYYDSLRNTGLLKGVILG